MNRLESSGEQVRALSDWFDRLADRYERLPFIKAANDDYVEQLA